MEQGVNIRKYLYSLIGILVLFGLYLTSLYSYPLFHSLAEIFSIVIACGIFMIAWNSRRFLDNNYLLFLGIGYLFVGALDLIHTLAYKGMGVFQGYETNLPTQLWIASRYMQSISLLIAPFFLRRKLKPNVVFLVYAIGTSFVLASIFYWNIFPICFVEGVGLTPFKKTSEYIISLILLASIALLLKNRREFDLDVFRWIVWSIILTIASELAFTFYIDAYGFSNLLGHFFKIASFYLIYKAIIQTGLARPHDLLFRNLKQSEEALRRSRDELEKKVQGRTVELAKANEELKAEIAERNRTEEALREQSKILEAFFTSTITPLIFLDRDFNFIRVNEAYAKACQHDVSEFPGHNHFEFYPSNAKKIFEQVVQTKEPYQAIARSFTFPDHPEWGETYWDWILTPILDGKGEVEFLVFSLEDVTNRVQTEKERTRLAHIVEATSDLIGMANLDGQLFYLNKAGRKMLGLSKDEDISGVSIPDTHPDWAKAAVLNEGIPTALQTGLWNGETTFLSRDGTEIPASQVILAHKGPNGEMEFLSTIARDITERKRAEEAVKAQRQRFNDVLEILPAYLVLLTPDYHVPFANRFFRERFGESHGRRCFEYLFGRSEPCDICETYTVLKTNAPHHWEWTGPDGRIYDIFDFPFTDTDGSPLIMEMGIDITEQKEVERRINATNVLLELFSKKSVRREYLNAVVDLLQSWSGCQCVGIRVLDRQGLIPYESYAGFSQEFWESENWLSIKRDQCACIRVITGNPDSQDSTVMTAGGSFYCDNTFKFIGQLSEQEKARFRGVCVENGFLSVSIIPIRYRGEVLGGIHLADEREGQVALKAMEFIESVAPLIGEAIHRFDLEEEVRESENRLRHLSSQLLVAQENERKRISREVHDSLGQSLSAIKFRVEGMLQEARKSREKTIAKSLENVIPIVQQSIEEARRIQMDLRPSVLDDLGILATISWFCREFKTTYPGINIETQVGIREEEVPDSLKTVIYRIMQEALNNIAKHSGADLVHLSLRKTDDKIELAIRDNGMGFDIEENLSVERSMRGLGLTSMRERAELSGGSFTVESIKGKGTTIRATWPL